MKWVLRLLLLMLLGTGGFLAFMLVPGYQVPFPEPDAAAPAKPASAEAWRNAAQADLAAIKKLLEDHTPIPFDVQNPDHGRWLKDGYAKAQAVAAQVTDENGHYFALSAYVNGFQDPHIAFNLTGERPDPKWPGFIASAKGENAIVVVRDENDPQAPALGTIFTGCDGASLDTFARERILPFVGNTKLAQSYRNTITRIFLDRHNPFAPRAGACTFEVPDGPKTIQLQWRDIPAGDAQKKAWFDKVRDAVFGPQTEWGVAEPAPGVTWIGVPTFSSGEETAPKLKQLIADVEAKAVAMRQGQAIIIDTRGNGGGNTFWSSRLMNAIFPPDAVKGWSKASGQGAADWRASEGNARYWRQTASDYAKEFGPFTIESLGALYLAGAIQAHKKDMPPIWRFPLDGAPGPTGGLTQKRPQSGEPPFPAKIFFLSNGSCGSTCLNFADEVLMIPGVKLIGSATSGDSAYMEVRDEALPSGLARLTFPQKVWRGMGRGNLEAYQPDITYDGTWDDASVRKWVLGLAQAKSAGKTPCRTDQSAPKDSEDVCRLPPIGHAQFPQPTHIKNDTAEKPNGAATYPLTLGLLIRVMEYVYGP
jgi:hypothetical protein